MSWRIRGVALLEYDLDVLRGKTTHAVPAVPFSVPKAPPPVPQHYVNAKVVLLGETAVGKSALADALMGQPFAPTESTHGRRVFLLDRAEVAAHPARQQRETLLWDLAGQPGYRVFHRQHLDEVAVGLVLFDARSETDPFAGVAYWARALDEATHGFPLIKLLVAARCDRFSTPASRERVDETLQRYGFAAFHETSAKRGDGVAELLTAIHAAIAWAQLPRVTAPELFAALKTFLIDEKASGRVLATRSDLSARFQQRHPAMTTPPEVLDTCLGRLEATNLLRRLSFGSYVLLQPELLDDYAAWIAQAARAEPDGLGAVAEDLVRRGAFPMDHDRALAKHADEKLLLAAAVEDVVERGIALRQNTERGVMLVFPSELRTELPELPGSYVRAIDLFFEGPVSAVYATLAVSLANTRAFEKQRFYRSAAMFRSLMNETCGIVADRPDLSQEIVGRVKVFFDAGTSRATKLLFVRFVSQQMEEVAFRGTVRAEQVQQCDCGYEIPADLIERRKARQETTVRCGDCGKVWTLDDLLVASAAVAGLASEEAARADEERQRQARMANLGEREKRAEMHVVLCHNSQNKPDVRRLGALLRDQGILAWIDEEQILPGQQHVPKIEEALRTTPAAAVVVGPGGLSRWEQQEYRALVANFVNAEGRKPAVIPVLLPGAPDVSALPLMLQTFGAVDFRARGLDDREELMKLVRGVLGDFAPR